jgi:RHS repeat-associated protein
VEESTKRYRYTGKERDEETGFSYHGARYLAVWLGRWIAADPGGMIDGPNFYLYVHSNPVRLTDATGLAVPLMIFVLGGVAVGFLMAPTTAWAPTPETQVYDTAAEDAVRMGAFMGGGAFLGGATGFVVLEGTPILVTSTTAITGTGGTAYTAVRTGETAIETTLEGGISMLTSDEEFSMLGAFGRNWGVNMVAGTLPGTVEGKIGTKAAYFTSKIGVESLSESLLETLLIGGEFDENLIGVTVGNVGGELFNSKISDSVMGVLKRAEIEGLWKGFAQVTEKNEHMSINVGRWDPGAAHITAKFDEVTGRLYISFVSVSENYRRLGFAEDLYRELIEHIGEERVEQVTGIMAVVNQQVWEETGDINSIPRVRILEKLGFHRHVESRPGEITSYR